MLGSHRPVRRQGRKPGTSSPTRRRLGRGDGRRQVGSCQVQAVLGCRNRYYRSAVLPPGGTTALCYRQQQTTPAQAKCSLSPAVLPAPDPVLPGPGTTAPCYRHQQTAPAEAPGPQAVLPVPERYYRTKRYYRSQVRYYRSWQCLRALVGPQPMYPPLLTKP